MRRIPALLTATATVWALSACSPVVQGTPALGLDAQGRLVGVVEPCSVDVSVAHLREDGADDDLVTWERSSSADGLEIWLLTPGRSLAWSRAGDLPRFAADTVYEFWVSAGDDQERTDRLTVTGADLAGLVAGQVLVPGGRTRDGGEPPAAVLGLAELDGLGC